MRRPLSACRLLAAAAGLFTCWLSASAQHLSFTVADLDGPGFALKALRVEVAYGASPALSLDIGTVSAVGQTWKQLKVICSRFSLQTQRISCDEGVLQMGSGEKIPAAFSWQAEGQRVELVMRPSSGEHWRLSSQVRGRQRDTELTFENLRLDRFSRWIPVTWPRMGSGTVSGKAVLSGERAKARIALRNLAFADAAGLRAGEKIELALEADIERRGTQWAGTLALDWLAGELFWQPWYLKAERQRLQATVNHDAGVTRVSDGRVQLPGMGAMSFAASWNHQTGVLVAGEVSGTALRADGLYGQWLKPLLQQTAFADLRVEGEVGVSLRLDAKGVAEADLRLDNFSLEDRARRFALFNTEARIPWRRQGATEATLSARGAEVLRLPIGAFVIPIALNGSRIDIPQVVLPVLDGTLTLSRFSVDAAAASPRFEISAEVAGISMERFAQAFGLPTMHGQISGTIPQVRYRDAMIDIDGVLKMQVFDGTVEARSVRLLEPFGRAPRLSASLDMRNLDLELLTRTFAFGSITGRVDVRLADLELVNWEPVRFDARIASSPGTYPRRISQLAVQNISALGGAGAGAAIQRTLLRFFDTFGYSRLGLSCRLINGVCEMDGIENAAQGFVIIKGGGIPAISVIGYNRRVNWPELVSRLKRITQDNVSPIVK